MAVTLAQLRLSAPDKLTQGFLADLEKASPLMAALQYDNCVTPGAGSNLVYGYDRQAAPSTASTRALNTEYEPSEATIEQKTSSLAILGGSFEIDRVTANATNGAAVDQLKYQLESKKVAIVNKFGDMFVNGDIGTDANGFDGIEKAIAGTSQVISTAVDISTAANMEANKHAFADLMDELLAQVSGDPDMFIVSSSMKTKMRGIARRLGVYDTTQTDAGMVLDTFAGIPFVSAGKNGAAEIVKTTAGVSPIYAVRLGMDAVHGVTLTGDSGIRVYAPDLNAPGAVKLGEAEVVATIAVKSASAVASLSGVKIAAA